MYCVSCTNIRIVFLVQIYVLYFLYKYTYCISCTNICIVFLVQIYVLYFLYKYTYCISCTNIRIRSYKKRDGTWRIKTNDELDVLIRHKNIINYIKAQRLSWFGHLQGMPEERMVKKCI